MEKDTPASSFQSPDRNLQEVAHLLNSLNKNQIKEKRYASVKLVLTLLGMGATIGTAFLAPNVSAVMGKALLKDSKGFDDWKERNIGYLRQTLKRLRGIKLLA